MKKEKLIPIIISIVLAIIAICLFFYNQSKKNEVYSKLVVNYNNETKEYENLIEVPVISVGTGKFILGSITPKAIILESNTTVLVDDKQESLIDIEGGKEQKVCFDANDCFSVTYSR